MRSARNCAAGVAGCFATALLSLVRLGFCPEAFGSLPCQTRVEDEGTRLADSRTILFILKILTSV